MHPRNCDSASASETHSIGPSLFGTHIGPVYSVEIHIAFSSVGMWIESLSHSIIHSAAGTYGRKCAEHSQITNRVGRDFKNTLPSYGNWSSTRLSVLEVRTRPFRKTRSGLNWCPPSEIRRFFFLTCHPPLQVLQFRHRGFTTSEPMPTRVQHKSPLSQFRGAKFRAPKDSISLFLDCPGRRDALHLQSGGGHGLPTPPVSPSAPA